MTDSSNSATRGKGPVFVRTRAFFFEGGKERSKDRPAGPERINNLRDDVELGKTRSSFRYQAGIELVRTYQENDADDCSFQHAARTKRYLREAHKTGRV